MLLGKADPSIRTRKSILSSRALLLIYTHSLEHQFILLHWLVPHIIIQAGSNTSSFKMRSVDTPRLLTNTLLFLFSFVVRFLEVWYMISVFTLLSCNLLATHYDCFLIPATSPRPLFQSYQ